ncbi:cyclic AMP-dependent transcription factor ATF-5-like isoform X3 [Amphibalanus amphitrite]|uniref:cyclic AMP-dependent transcription factor ATF-5-like isoform X3 n=1 Tax=Amphibalanus amphitrite TaxID=1232801 RepID=UPI001C902F49|nr:cyclic AMP-dependent transcription factor ATF-5-like isoform X3 [Amphibalanus amphitrite]
MLKEAKLEVPSLVLGPPSPSWIDLIVGSPPGLLKEPRVLEDPTPPLEAVVQTRVQSRRQQPASASEISSASRTISSASRTISSTSCVAERATNASCESRKRTTTSSGEFSKTTTTNSVKRRCVEVSGDETPATAHLDDWSAAVAVDTLNQTFLAPSSGMEGYDAELMSELWGDLLLDASPEWNGSSLDAAVLPCDQLPTPTPLSDSHLIDEVSEEQLLELAEILEPAMPEVAAAAAAQTESLPPPPPPAPATTTTEAPAAATIDLAALLEETEIVFSPELATPSEPAPAAPPVAPPAAEESTHYLLVVTPPADTSGGPSSSSSETPDDPEWEPDDASSRWSSISTDAEPAESLGATAPTRKRAARRPPAATPAEKYRRIRDTNNEASRRSRQQRKQRELDTQSRAEQLESENARLRERAAVLEGLLERVKALAPLLTAKR